MIASVEVVRSRQLEHLRHSLAMTPAIIASQRIKGPPMMLQMNLEFFVRDSLHLAILESPDAPECSAFLIRTKAIEYLDEFICVVAGIRAGGDPWSVSSNTIDIVAVPLLLGDVLRAQKFVDVVLEGAHSTKFWMEYIRGIRALLRREVYLANPPKKLAGAEKHWASYLALMEALTAGISSDEQVILVRESFDRANRDRRLFNVGAIDPTGNAPQAWDCRLEYIKSGHELAKHAALQSVVQPSLPGDGPALRPCRA